MTGDEILRALETADRAPVAALQAGVERAQEIAPRVAELLRKAGEGVFLLPEQQNVVFFGLYALAAARETSVFQPLCKLLHQPENDLEPLFGDALTNDLTSFLTSLFDGDVAALTRLIDDAEADGAVKWGVFNALAYLVFDGRLPREDVVAVLRRFGEGDPVQDDLAWHGWRDAIALLGAEELKARAIETWIPAGSLSDREIDKQGWIDDFKPAMDKNRLNDPHIRPIDDPVAAVSWLSRNEPAARDPADPAKDPLNDEELGWLMWLLASSQAPANAMSLEMLDGYFAALVVGPETIMPSRWMKRMWDTVGDETIVYDSREQLEFVTKLLMRHWNAVAARLADDYPHQAIINSHGTDLGVEWATGFSLGLTEAPGGWRELMRRPRVRDGIMHILSLCAEEFDPNFNPDTDELTFEERKNVVAMIPRSLALIHDERTGRAPVRRAAKVGRNEPCPCGSGRKFKLCCQPKERDAIH